jgi:hypothetical protein
VRTLKCSCLNIYDTQDHGSLGFLLFREILARMPPRQSWLGTGASLTASWKEASSLCPIVSVCRYLDLFAIFATHCIVLRPARLFNAWHFPKIVQRVTYFSTCCIVDPSVCYQNGRHPSVSYLVVTSILTHPGSIRVFFTRVSEVKEFNSFRCNRYYFCLGQHGVYTIVMRLRDHSLLFSL